jgi:hypothetical protein
MLQFNTAHTESAVSSPVVPGCQQCPLLQCSQSYRLTTVSQVTECCNCLMAISCQPATLLTAVSSLNSSTSCPSYNVFTRTAQKTQLLCCCFQLLPYKHACLLVLWSLPSNGSICHVLWSLPSNGSICHNMHASLDRE